MFSYSQVESVLAQISGIEDSRKSAFRGRLKHFRRLGLIAEKPGKGKKISYSVQDIWLLAFAFEISQFGIEPNKIKSVIDAYDKHIIEKFVEANKDKRQVQYAQFNPEFVSQAADAREAVGSLSFWSVDWHASNCNPLFWEGLGRRCALICVSDIRRDVDRALAG